MQTIALVNLAANASDNAGPSVINITAPADIQVGCYASTAPGRTGRLTASTNCSGGGLDISFEDTRNAGSCAQRYTITRTWTVRGTRATKWQCVRLGSSSVVVFAGVGSR